MEITKDFAASRDAAEKRIAKLEAQVNALLASQNAISGPTPFEIKTTIVDGEPRPTVVASNFTADHITVDRIVANNIATPESVAAKAMELNNRITTAQTTATGAQVMAQHALERAQAAAASAETQANDATSKPSIAIATIDREEASRPFIIKSPPITIAPANRTPETHMAMVVASGFQPQTCFAPGVAWSVTHGIGGIFDIKVSIDGVTHNLIFGVQPKAGAQ